jgi:hypothetical protein
MTAAVYLRELHDLESQDVSDFISSWVNSQEFPPRIVDIRQGVEAIIRKRERESRPSEEEGTGFRPNEQFLRDMEQGYVSTTSSSFGAQVGPVRRDVLKALYDKSIWPEEWGDEEPPRELVRPFGVE